MSGRKRYDEEAALDAAMRAFWERGYEGASVAALERATGLNKSSLYNAYQSKDRLFEICLKRFSTRYGGRLAETLEAPRFADAMRDFFDALIERFEDPGAPDGCMTTMAAMEASAVSGPARAFVRANQEALRGAFAQRAAKAVTDGDLPEGTDCDALGAMLVAQARGIAVLNRGTGDAALARDAVRGALALLPKAT
ncbi:MAG: TetR/AcrR family transcriptional regulator [Pseudomonadota bacterium]